MANVGRLISRALQLGSQAVGVAKALAIASGTRSHPQLNGRIDVAGLRAPIEVRRDRAGVPHITAASDEDAIFGQGFVHAQDRLFQMETMRLLAAGRVSEIGGAGSLEADRFMRRLGLAGRARGDLLKAPDEDALLLSAYARGVNEGVNSLPALPPEFAVLGRAPETWHAEHTLLVGRLLSFSFAGNWDTELLRERLLADLGPARMIELDRGYPAGAITSAGGEHADAVERLLSGHEAAQAAGLLVAPASNGWALSGHRTASGAPLLANDPHLQAQVPGLFHVSHVRGDRIDVIGADVPGIPGVASGHNGQVAWGITAGVADVSDCYIEAVDPDDPARYLTPDGWLTGETRTERIAVRGGETVEERVLETRHGPIIGPAIVGEGRAVALRSTALEDGELASAFLDISRSTDAETFEAALDRWAGASFNFVWASVGGGIGYRLVGHVPERAGGEGLLPQDGARSAGPSAALPPSEMPRLVDPPEGAVISANNAPGSDRELGEEWYEPWRAERIRELLDARPTHDIESITAIQMDESSRPMLMLRDLLLDRDSIDVDSTVRAQLAAWDGQLTAASTAAAVLEHVYMELARMLVGRVAGLHAPVVLGEGVGRAAPSSTFHYRLQGPLLDVLQQPREPWLAGEDDRDRLLRAAVGRATAHLTLELGPDASVWSWGALHGLRPAHALRSVPVLGPRFSRGPYPYGGDVNTVNTGGYTVWHGLEGRGYNAAYRQVIDLGDFDRSVFQLPVGNSGIPGHPRYDDCTAEYLTGQFRPLPYSRAAVERATEHVLRLLPEASGA